MNKEKTKKVLNISMMVITTVMVCLIIYGLKNNLFTSQGAMESFVSKFGIWAPLIFIIFQMVQVVFPIAPGGITLLVGVLLFGSAKGFVYNYIGIVLGSALAFLISKHYGTPIIEVLFGKSLREKYSKWTNHANFARLFALAIFFPFAPDDILCYIAGTTNMSFSYFLTTIVLGKPLSIAAYSFGLNAVLRHLPFLVH